MSTKIWLIRLRPLEPFYFGGANNFSAGSDPYKVNYLSRSNYFPQQTSLLGMLRYCLLEQAGKLPLSNNNRPSAKALIGAESFHSHPIPSPAAATGTPVSAYGKIIRLSPVFIQRVVSNPDGTFSTAQCIFRNANEHFEYDKAAHTLQLAKKPVEVSFNRNVWQPYHAPEAPFSGKNAPEPTLVDALDGTILPLDYDKEKKKGLFIEDWRVGIVKKDREEAFYKQCFYRFASPASGGSYCFAFYAELDTTVTLTDAIVQLGGDRSSFALNAVVAKAGNDPLTEPATFYGNLFQQKGDRSLDKLVLLSDSRVNAMLFSHLQFGVTNGQPFRNNRASVDTTQRYGPLAAKGRLTERFLQSIDVPQRGQAHYLLAAGSVLYTTDIPRLKVELDKFPHFQTIGYNHYIHIPKA